MKTPLYIQIDNDNKKLCDIQCPFLDKQICLLFGHELYNSLVHDGVVRCFPCFEHFDTD